VASCRREDSNDGGLPDFVDVNALRLVHGDVACADGGDRRADPFCDVGGCETCGERLPGSYPICGLSLDNGRKRHGADVAGRNTQDVAVLAGEGDWL